MLHILAFILLSATSFTVISGACDRYYGPSGGYECVPLRRYNNVPQRATCLTDTYIRAKSKSMGNNHECDDSSRTYCYYQCMCETYNECEGPKVYGECACDPNNTQVATTDSSRPTLPPWCFSPNGSTCSWYRECLEERYPCEGTNAAYAITYAEKFCDLYSDHYQSFSTDGQRWINAVRECLQVALVPLLRPWASATCLDIKKMAFSSHSNCYTGPASAVSFCSLSLGDKWRVFMTIKNAFTDSFVETMKGMLETMRQCSGRFLHNGMLMTRIYVKRLVSMGRDPNTFAGKIVDKIAEKEKWAVKGLSWFGYNGASNNGIDHMQKKGRATTADSEFRIDIILASKREFDLNTPNITEANTTGTVISLANSIRNGLTRLTVDGVRVDILSMAACIDVDCNSTLTEVQNVPVNAGPMPKTSGSFVFMVGILNLVYRKF